MFDGAKSVVSVVSAIAAGLFILWLIGAMTTKGSAHGMTAVGSGISAIFKGIGELFGSIHF